MRTLLPALLLLAGPASAGEVEGEVHGDVKLFTTASFPFAWFAPPEIPPEAEPFLPDDFDPQELLDQSGYGTDATVSGAAGLRLKATVRVGDRSKFEIHQALALLDSGASTGLGGSQAGIGLTAPELVPLTWTPDIGDRAQLQLRTDRLVWAYSGDGVDVTVGRQPVTFGSGLIFTPMDVVNPFSPATIDTEYKPGVDALRVDGYAGVAGRISGVVAWASTTGPLAEGADNVELADIILAANGQATVGVTDVQLLLASARAEPVFGAGVISALGPIGIHGDVTLTLPVDDADEDDPFVRAVLGADGRPTQTTTISGELAYQGNGAADPSGYLEVAQGKRFARGETWQMGRYYGALAVNQEITPLVVSSVAVIANLADPSALIAPSLSWSVGDNTAVGGGGYIGVGERPDEVPLGLAPETFALTPPTQAELADSVNSEFGLIPVVLFLSARSYF